MIRIIEAQTQGPLTGWRVVSTRARAPAESLVTELNNLGATIIECPTIAIAPPRNWAELDAALKQLEQYDWLIFTSANGVEYFLRRRAELGYSAALPGQIKVVAVGPATAARLRDYNIKVEFIPTEQQAEGLLSALLEQIGAEQIAKTRFLFPRARAGRDLLPIELRQLGAQIDVVEAYQTVQAEVDRTQLIELLQAGIELIIFTSPSTVRNLAAILETNDLSDYLNQAAVATMGPTTSGAANKFKLPVAIEPAVHTAAELVRAIVDYAREHPNSTPSKFNLT